MRARPRRPPRRQSCCSGRRTFFWFPMSFSNAFLRERPISSARPAAAQREGWMQRFWPASRRATKRPRRVARQASRTARAIAEWRCESLRETYVLADAAARHPPPGRSTPKLSGGPLSPCEGVSRDPSGRPGGGPRRRHRPPRRRAGGARGPSELQGRRLPSSRRCSIASRPLRRTATSRPFLSRPRRPSCCCSRAVYCPLPRWARGRSSHLDARRRGDRLPRGLGVRARRGYRG